MKPGSKITMRYSRWLILSFDSLLINIHFFRKRYAHIDVCAVEHCPARVYHS